MDYPHQSEKPYLNALVTCESSLLTKRTIYRDSPLLLKGLQRVAPKLTYVKSRLVTHDERLNVFDWYELMAKSSLQLGHQRIGGWFK